MKPRQLTRGHRRPSGLSRVFLLVSAAAFTASAQTTSGSIAGNIVDQQQAAVPGASIRVNDAAKGFTQNTVSDREGRFVFPQLAPGTYTLDIEAKGFKRSERTNLELVANDKMALGTITLDVGAVTDTVTVSAEATLVQSESAERSLAIEGETLRSIAVNGRGFTPLASIVPGIIFNTNNGSSDAITNIFANGLRSSANNLQLDGISIVDTGNNGTLLSLNLDSVSEFKVLTSNYQAEYGRSAGAQISAVTRGGTRDFHGSAYGFRRHDGMNANTWINNRDSTATNHINKPRLDQRDLGFTIGGPIYIPKHFNTSRQKLFFFYSHEDQKRFIPPTGPTRVTVPTAAERAGDFSKTVDNAGQPLPLHPRRLHQPAVQFHRGLGLFRRWRHTGQNSHQPALWPGPEHPQAVSPAECHRRRLQLQHGAALQPAADPGPGAHRLQSVQQMARLRPLYQGEERPGAALRFLRAGQQPAGL